MSEISAGCGIGAFAGEAKKLSKPGAFMEFLQEGLSVLPRNPEAERKALEAFAGVLKRRQVMKEAAAVGTVEKAGEVVKEAQENGLGDHIMAMAQVFGLGNKHSLKDRELVQTYGLTKKEILKMTDSELETLRLERIQAGYRTVFYKAHPQLKGSGLEVHHALPQTLLDRCPGLFKAKEIHSLEYLRGIPKSAMVEGEGVHDLISDSWRQFLKQNENPTRAQVLKHMRKLDEEFGRFFVPPLEKGAR
jgi:hypothetical protein